MNSLNPELICELPVFAASGLVISSGKFFIVSDDEISLLSGVPGRFEMRKLWDHDLPEDPKERKKIKPDLECLYLNGRKLFLLPSFSRLNRFEGAIVDLDESGEILGHKVIDFADLRLKLDKLIPDLNIEGALIFNHRLHLFQRGNGKNGSNSVIICDDLKADNFQVINLMLPVHKDIPLTVTDAALRGQKIYFTAVAENTDSTYLDGEVLGAFLGTLNESFEVDSLREIPVSGKPEGLSFDAEGSMYFVTDDDSRETPSRLFRIRDY